MGPLPISEPLCECVHALCHTTSSWGYSDYYSYPRVLAGIFTPEAANNSNTSLKRPPLVPHLMPVPHGLPDLGQQGVTTHLPLVWAGRGRCWDCPPDLELLSPCPNKGSSALTILAGVTGQNRLRRGPGRDRN